MLRRPDHWYPPLTRQQLEAVEDRANAIFINGDAGTGLTHVLCSRGLRLMDEGVEPEEVLYLTWSLEGAAAVRRTFRRWAQEAGTAPTPERRASALRLAENARRAREFDVLTVMESCLVYLRERGADFVGLDPCFSLLTLQQQMQLVSRLAHQGAATRSLSSAELQEFLLWHRRDLACTNFMDDEYGEDAMMHNMLIGQIIRAGLQDWAIPQPPSDEALLELGRIYGEEKRRQGALDLDEVIQTAARALREDMTRQPHPQRHGRHLLVDQAEDMTPAALEVILNEMNFFDTVTVAYNRSLRTGMWRGTDPGAFMALLQDHIRDPSQHFLRLDARSSRILSDFLTRLAEMPTLAGLQERTAVAFRPGGQAPRLREFQGQDALIQGLLESIQAFAQNGERWEDLACLFRWPDTLERCRASLEEAGIPHSAMTWQTRAPYRDAESLVGLLTLLLNPRDLEALLDAAVVRSPNGWIELNLHNAAALVEVSRRQEISLVEAARQHARTLSQRSPSRIALDRVINGVDVLQGMLDEGIQDRALLQLMGVAYRTLTNEANPRVERNGQIHRLAVRAHNLPHAVGEPIEEHLRRFLDSITIRGIPIQERQGITLSTIPDVKGLQWNEVWVVGAGQRMIPGQDGTHPALPLWEEQRLLYAAATRARDNLVFFNEVDSDLERIWGNLLR